MAGTKDLGALIAQIGTDMRQWEDSMQRMEKDMKNAERVAQTSAEKMNQQFEKVGRQMESIGKSMSKYVTLPLVAFGALALRTAGQFEKSMNKVAAISQATGGELAELEKQARDLGKSTQFSASEAADAMSFLAMAGFEVTEIMSAMPATLNLAAAGQMDLARSADIVSNVMQGFGIAATQTDEVVDVLAKTFTSANTDLEELGQAMSYAAPVAKAYGISVEETAAAIGFLGDAGIKATRAGTGVRQMLLQLAAKADELGLSIYDAAGNMKPIAGLLEEIEKSGIPTTKMIEVLGARAGPGLAVLLDRGSEALRDYTEELADSGGTAQRVAEQQMEGLFGALKELRSAFEELQIAIAKSGILDFATNLVKRVTELVRRMADMDPAILRLITGFAGLAAAAGPVLIVMGLFTRKILPLFTSQILAARAATLKLNAVFLKNPVGIAIAGMVALAVAIKTVTNRINRLTADQEALVRVQEAGIKEMDKEASRIDVLTRTLKNHNIPLNYRKEALEELNKIVPEYNARLDEEGTLIEGNTKALDEYLKRLKEKTMLQAFEEELTSAFTQQRQAVRALTQAQKELEEAEETYWDKSSTIGLSILARKEQAVNKAEKALNESTETIETLSTEMEEFTRTTMPAVKATGDLTEVTDEASSALREQVKQIHQLEIATRALTQAEIERAAQKRMSKADASMHDPFMGIQEGGGQITPMEQTMRRMREELAYTARMSMALGEEFDSTNAQIAVHQQALESLIRQGYMPGHVAVDTLIEKLAGLSEETEEYGIDLTGLGHALEHTSAGLDRLQDAFAGVAAEGLTFSNAMKIIQQTATTLIGVLGALSAVNLIAEESKKGIIGIATAAAGLAALAGMITSFANPKRYEPQGLATGGDVLKSGVFKVGERGEENVFLPKGAAVRPTNASSAQTALVGEFHRDRMRIWLKDGDERDKRNY